jgi:hypothetical protein
MTCILFTGDAIEFIIFIMTCILFTGDAIEFIIFIMTCILFTGDTIEFIIFIMTCILFTGDAIEFMSWFLNAVHGALNGNRKLSSSIVNKTFRGTMRVYTHKMLPIEMVSTIYSYEKMIEI